MEDLMLKKTNLYGLQFWNITPLGLEVLTTTPQAVEPEVRGDEFLKAEEFFECFILFLSPLVFIANIIVIVSSWMASRERSRDQKSVYASLFTIATADFLVCLAVWFELIEINSLNHKYLCAVKLGCVVSGSLTSMLSICLVALERFLFLVHGLQYDAFLTPTRMGLLIAFLWVAGLSCGLVPVLVEAARLDGEYVEVCEFIRSPLWVAAPAAALALPALVLTPVLYTAVFCRLRRLGRRMSGTAHIPRLKLRSVVVVLLSSAAFLLCWGPYLAAASAYKLYCEPRGLPCRGLELALVSPLACLAFANSLLNPLIYAWWHPPYNLALRRVLCPAGRTAKARPSLYRAPSVHTIT